MEKRLQGYKKSIKVAVMGCVVNGPGEAREADIGIAGGKGEAVLFLHGKPVKKLTGDNILDQFMDEIYKPVNTVFSLLPRLRTQARQFVLYKKEYHS